MGERYMLEKIGLRKLESGVKSMSRGILKKVRLGGQGLGLGQGQEIDQDPVIEISIHTVQVIDFHKEGLIFNKDLQL